MMHRAAVGGPRRGEDPAWLQSCRFRSQEEARRTVHQEMFYRQPQFQRNPRRGGSVRVNMSRGRAFYPPEKARVDPEFIRAMEEVMSFDSQDEDEDGNAAWHEPQADYEGTPYNITRPRSDATRVQNKPYRNSTGSDTVREDGHCMPTGGIFRPRSGSGPDVSRPKGKVRWDMTNSYHDSSIRARGQVVSSSHVSPQLARANVKRESSPQMARATAADNTMTNGTNSLSLHKANDNAAHVYSKDGTTYVICGGREPVMGDEAAVYSSGQKQTTLYSNGVIGMQHVTAHSMGGHAVHQQAAYALSGSSPHKETTVGTQQAVVQSLGGTAQQQNVFPGAFGAQQATVYSSGGDCATAQSSAQVSRQPTTAYSMGNNAHSSTPQHVTTYNSGIQQNSGAMKRERIMTTLQKAIDSGWFYAYGIVVRNLADMHDMKYVSKNRESSDQVVRSPFVVSSGPGSSDNSWYHSGMTRELAVEILRREQVGSFIIRDNNNQPGYALSVKVRAGREADVIRHFLLLKTVHGGIILKDLPAKEWPNMKCFIGDLTNNEPTLAHHLGLRSN